MDLLIYSEYKDYLNHLYQRYGTRSGIITQLAAASNTYTSYISKVLKGDANLSIEQAEMISRYLGHDELQSYYFILLVLKERAGTVNLKKLIELQIDKLNPSLRQTQKALVG